MTEAGGSGTTRPRARHRKGAMDGTLVLNPVPPFNFDLSASIFAGGDPQIRSYSDGIFRQVTRVSGALLFAEVTSGGSGDHPEVHLRLEPGSVAGEMAREAGEIIARIFNLDLDLSPFITAVKDDPVMSAIARRLRGLKPPRTMTVFEALVDSIIEQQISLTAAHSIEKRVTRTFGDTLEWEGREYYAFPTPGHLADASPDELRACGLSLKKAEYILGIARQIREGTLDLETHGPAENTENIVREFSALRGVGVWTAELAALRGLSRLDALPADDLGIRRSISRYYSKASRIDTAEARRIAGAWGEWKGLAAYYLLVAERMGIGVPDLEIGP
ncbi:MAG: DNA-3-methyladenine glycosylase [Methanomicrobiales archaeon]